MKLLPLRYFLVTLSITFFYNIVLPFVADARYICQHMLSGWRLNSKCSNRKYHGCSPTAGSGFKAMSVTLLAQIVDVHSEPPCWECNYEMMKNFFLPPSKFFLDKFNGYSQQEAATTAGTVYVAALVLTTVAGCIIVRIWICWPL